MDEDIDYAALFGVTPETGPTQSGPPPEPSEAGSTPTADVPEGSPQPEAEPEEQDGGQGTDPTADAPDASPQPGANADAADPGREQGRSQGEVNDAAAKAREAAQKAIDEAFALSGLKNPYTGQAITSKAEYDAYRVRFEAERREQVLKQTGMTQEEFQKFVQELPEVRQARQAKEEMERAVREARAAAARVKVDEQLREISALDPSIKSLEDLLKMPTYPKFYELVKGKITLTDAFRLANFDALTQRSAAGARQAAVNSARSKEHLAETKTRGGGGVSVPADVREQYKLFNPEATEEEIQRHWQRSHKN